MRIPSDVRRQPDTIARRSGTGLAALLVVALSAADVAAQSPVQVVTTTEDLASLTREIGGEAVSVEAIARGYQDPHFVEAKPSFVFKLNSAQLLVVVGRELEMGWLPPLITQSRNSKLQPGGAGYLDASQTARILDIPTGQITRAMGDVHPSGNPHYWLDPSNGRRIGKAVQDALTSLSGGDAAYFAQRYADFDRRLAAAESRWRSTLAPYKGTKVVTYHRSWSNFAEAFGLDVIGYVEPKPGVPPSPSHTFELINLMKAQKVKAILVEPYFDLKTPKSIAERTGANLLVMYPSVGARPELDDYFKLFDRNITELVKALR